MDAICALYWHVKSEVKNKNMLYVTCKPDHLPVIQANLLRYHIILPNSSLFFTV